MPTNTIIRGSHYFEQNPVEWWEQIVAVTRKACLDESLNKQIGYMTVTASAACLVALDSSGCPTYNSLMVSDKRAVAEAERIEQFAQRTAALAKTPQLRNQIGAQNQQRVRTHFALTQTVAAYEAVYNELLRDAPAAL